MQVQRPPEYCFDDFRLDVRKRQLLRAGEVIQLNPKAFDLLLVLVQNAGQLLSKDDLFERVWSDQIVEESNLTVNMSAIRRALGEQARQPRYITTVSGEGYCFVGDVTEKAPGEEQFIVESRTMARVVVEQEEVENAPLALPGSKRNRMAVAAVVGGVLLLLLAAGGYFVRRVYLSKGAGAAVAASIKKLTNNGKAGVAALSPDSRMFAFSLHEGKRSSLWLGYVDGGEPIQILPSSEMIFLHLKFSPDGSSLYFVSSENFRRGDLYRMPVLGGPAEKIADNVQSTVTFAPDGRRMAFVRIDDASKKHIVVLTDLHAADAESLAEVPADYSLVANTPNWSPDGASIAIGATGSDGTFGRIFVAKLSEKKFEPVSAETWTAITGLTWLHDGTGLLFVAKEKDALAPQLWQIAFPGGESRRVISDLNLYAGSISLSADDKNVLAVQAQTESNLWVSPAEDPDKAKQITFGSAGQNNGWYGLQWLADGRIVYTKQAGNNISIWSCASDGGNQKQLIPGAGVNILPSVPSNGNYVVFQSNRGGNQAIWRANIDGSNLVQLSGEGRAGEPRVSPDGNWAVYVADHEGGDRLMRVSISGGAPEMLTETVFSWVDISPDSRLIAGGCEENGKPKLCILPIDGGKTLNTFDVPRLANFRLGVHWSPDGRSITYRDWGNGIWTQSLSGGEPTMIKGLPEEKLYGYGWSTDGKQFAYARGLEMNDVVWITGSDKF